MQLCKESAKSLDDLHLISIFVLANSEPEKSVLLQPAAVIAAKVKTENQNQ